MWILSSFFEGVKNILFPKSCFLCQKESVTLCTQCITSLSRSVSTPEPFIFSYFSYRDAHMKKMIHYAKYYKRKDLLYPLIEKTIPEVKSLLQKEEDYILIPIPMNRIRKLTRGYNQTEVMADIYSALLHIPASKTVLQRTKITLRQTKSKNRTTRLRNQKGSFTLKHTEELSGKCIILVDDITTTGATLLEARKLFLKSGFHSVTAVTLAH